MFWCSNFAKFITKLATEVVSLSFFPVRFEHSPPNTQSLTIYLHDKTIKKKAFDKAFLIRTFLLRTKISTENKGNFVLISLN